MNIHVIIIISIISFSIFYGKWNRWKDFYPTMYYFSFFNLFYQYISYSIDKVWELKKPIFSLFITDVSYTFLAYPCLMVMFLGNYPSVTRHKFLFYLKYIVLSIGLEWVCNKYGYIQYYNGWSVWWTAFFYSTMYPMIRLHFKKPILALFISGLIIAFYLTIFDFSIL
ncbi:CBO0543 family protein [Radiobacillus deserti]|uniref:Uncharacterized protein n=1 Tax=Radiobacillus deserti TaxID=2594883 RepID=A0A516KKD4_9BACI|nr:CBO0543 family protein [Radiobacillus deserti]QDP41863.1 hypothetical protein FN924_17800 [Radiobacillus deserti]